MIRWLKIGFLCVSLSGAAVSAETLTGLRIDGPTAVPEESTALYRVIAEFDNGWEFDVTLDSYLWVDPGVHADIGLFGDLTVQSVEADVVETIHAVYAFGSDVEDADLAVTIRDLAPAGFALSFDGVDDQVVLPDGLIADRTSLTLEAWFRTTGSGVIFGYQNTPYPWTPSNYVPAIYVGADGRLHATIFDGLVGPLSGGDAVNDGRWHHLALTARLFSQKLYLDGEEVSSSSVAEFVHLDMIYNQIGLGYAGEPWPEIPPGWSQFEGAIDEVRLWSHARDGDDIALDRNRSLLGNEEGLIGYWRFDTGYGQFAIDFSPSMYDGVLGLDDDGAGDDSDPAWIRSGAGITSEPFVRYVDDDAPFGGDGLFWHSAYRYLQDALLEAQGDPVITEIRVAGGLYRPDRDEGGQVTAGDESATFRMLNGVGVYGAYAGLADPEDQNRRDPVDFPTLLDGDLQDNDQPDHELYFRYMDDNSEHVVTGSQTDGSAVLDTCTIRRGRGDGGGLYIVDGSPGISNCTFTQSLGDGSGIYNQGGTPCITGCTFIDGHGFQGAGFHNRHGTPLLTQCTFTLGDGVYGGAVYNRDGNTVLQQCVIVGNNADHDGGGVYVQRGSVSLTDCVLHSNMAGDQGGGMFAEASATLNNCSIYGNSGDGGGMYLEDGATTLVNCALGGNGEEAILQEDGTLAMMNCTIVRDTGPVLETSGVAALTNCILRSNGAVPIVLVGGGSADVTYSNVEGDWPGEGNFDADPLFVDALGPDSVLGTPDDDLRLTYESPCVNAGSDDATGLPETDLAGEPRIQACRVDQGVYESPHYLDCNGNGVADSCDIHEGSSQDANQTYIPDECEAVLFVDPTVGGLANGVSWANALPHLQDALAIARLAPGVVEEIWIVAGIHTPEPAGGDPSVAFRLVDGVTVVGGFAGWETGRSQRDPEVDITVLSGDLDGNDVLAEFPTGPSYDDNSESVVRLESPGATAGLDGIVVTGGSRKSASSLGGGISVAEATIVLNGCIVSGNSADSGGAIYVTEGTLDARRSVLRGNVAASFGGGVLGYRSTLSLEDSLLTDNEAADSGGALRDLLGTAAVRNCTVARNTALAGTGGGLSCVAGDLTVTSCVLWANTDSAGGGEAGQINAASAVVDYSIVEGWTGSLGGIGNAGDDPALADPMGPDGLPGTDDDNLRPSFQSPCIDAGDPTFTPDPGAMDLDGRPRVRCDRVDIGAYEGGWGDVNCDHILDLADFADWPACFDGPDSGPYADACTTFDFDSDGDVDLADFATFAAEFASP